MGLGWWSIVVILVLQLVLIQPEKGESGVEQELGVARFELDVMAVAFCHDIFLNP